MKCDFEPCLSPDEAANRIKNLETGHEWDWHPRCLAAYLVVAKEDRALADAGLEEYAERLRDFDKPE